MIFTTISIANVTLLTDIRLFYHFNNWTYRITISLRPAPTFLLAQRTWPNMLESKNQIVVPFQKGAESPSITSCHLICDACPFNQSALSCLLKLTAYFKLSLPTLRFYPLSCSITVLCLVLLLLWFLTFVLWIILYMWLWPSPHSFGDNNFSNCTSALAPRLILDWHFLHLLFGFFGIWTGLCPHVDCLFSASFFYLEFSFLTLTILFFNIAINLFNIFKFLTMNGIYY